MGLTTVGRNLAVQGLVGEAITAFNNANSRIGVGDSSTAFAAGQTDLQAASNKFRRVMEATYPQRAGNAVTFRSLFSTSEANFVWAEWGVFNAASSGSMLSRKVEALGTKTSAQSWQLTVTLTLNAA